MGVYLFISVSFCNRHGNEAFSALRIEDYKNFLRIKFDKEGKCIIFPIGVENIDKARRVLDGKMAHQDGSNPWCLIEEVRNLIHRFDYPRIAKQPDSFKFDAQSSQ